MILIRHNRFAGRRHERQFVLVPRRPVPPWPRERQQELQAGQAAEGRGRNLEKDQPERLARPGRATPSPGGAGRDSGQARGRVRRRPQTGGTDIHWYRMGSNG
jgi:hypothetical protein